MLGALWGIDLWYAFPPVIAVSLVYAATRHERLVPILRHALGFALRIIALMAVILAILMMISL
jgi:predicted Zn-dependent protease